MRVELSRTVTHFVHLQMYNLLDCFEHRKYVLQWPKESNFAFSEKENHFILPREYPKEKNVISFFVHIYILSMKQSKIQ